MMLSRPKLSRRGLIVTATSSCILAAAGCRLENQSGSDTLVTPNETRKTYVLVHGAWHGGWCWRYVRNELVAKGHRVFTPTLTGLGERSHLASKTVDLTTHVTDVLNLIQFEDLRDVVLVGHSYAGLVVSLVADRARETIKEIVYLDAVLPDKGQSFFPKEQHDRLIEAYAADFALPPSGLQFLGIPDDHEHAEWVQSRLTPHPLGTFLEPVIYENEGAKGLPKTFIRCLKNPRYTDGDPVKLMTEADVEWAYLTIDTGHDAMITAPDELAAVLETV